MQRANDHVSCHCTARSRHADAARTGGRPSCERGGVAPAAHCSQQLLLEAGVQLQRAARRGTQQLQLPQLGHRRAVLLLPKFGRPGVNQLCNSQHEGLVGAVTPRGRAQRAHGHRSESAPYRLCAISSLCFC